MIKASELRKGNLFLYKGNVTEVVGVDQDDYIIIDNNYFDDGVEHVKEEDGEPIALTPEWPGKLGFITLDAETDIEVWGLDDDSNGEEFSLISDGLDTPLPLYFEYDLGYRNVRKEIKYVHQLQNLYFALTCEELTIKN